jgi:hypothetical protein
MLALLTIQDRVMNTYTTRLRRDCQTNCNGWYIQDVTESTRYGEWVKDDTGRLLRFDHKVQALGWIAEHGEFASNK